MYGEMQGMNELYGQTTYDESQMTDGIPDEILEMMKVMSDEELLAFLQENPEINALLNGGEQPMLV